MARTKVETVGIPTSVKIYKGKEAAMSARGSCVREPGWVEQVEFVQRRNDRATCVGVRRRRTPKRVHVVRLGTLEIVLMTRSHYVLNRALANDQET